MRFGRRLQAPLTDPEVDQPLAQVGLFDPLRDLGVARVGHQQRQAEVVQQALGDAFPVALVFAHLQQFADEGQRGLVQLQRTAEARTDVENRAGRLERRLRSDSSSVSSCRCCWRRSRNSTAASVWPFCALSRCCWHCSTGRAAPDGWRERLGVVRLRQLQRAGEVVIAFGGMLAALLVRFQPGDFLPDRRRAVTAVLGDGAGQFVAFRLALPLVLLQRAALLALAGDVLGEVIRALVQQLGLEPGEPGRQRFAAGDQPLRLLEASA